MPESNAELLVAYVRQETRFQITTELKANDIRDFVYEEIAGLEPGQPVKGRFEIVIYDEALADKIEKMILSRGTGYNPPDVTVIRASVYAKSNG